MIVHPIFTLASPSAASLLFDASCDSVESLTTTFAASVVPTLETTTVTEVALGHHFNQQYSITAMTTSTGAVAERYAYTAYGQPTICTASGTSIGCVGSEWGVYEFVRAKSIDVIDPMGLWQRPGPQIPGSLSLTFAGKSKRCISYSDPFVPDVAGVDTIRLNGGAVMQWV